MFAPVRDYAISPGSAVGGPRRRVTFYLPPYSPELNPEEGLNADLKQVVTRKAPARSKRQLKQAALSHMRKLAKMPQRIRAYFQHPQFRYAA